MFEAVARHGSLDEAARELGLERPTVGRTVRQLEDELGISLIARRQRAVELTDAGHTLYEAVRSVFSELHPLARGLELTARSPVIILCTSAHAHCWLAPRLPDLRKRHPGITLRVDVVTEYVELEQPEHRGMVLGLWSGKGPRSGYECVEFAVEEVFPVASPAYARDLTCGDDLAALAAQRLIHEEQRMIPTVTWKEFFDAFGYKFRDGRRGIRLTHYESVLQAAIAGQGIAIAWEHFAAPLIAAGLLVPVGSRRLRTGRQFYVVWPAESPLAPAAELVRNWLTAPVEPASPTPSGP